MCDSLRVILLEMIGSSVRGRITELSHSKIKTSKTACQLPPQHTLATQGPSLGFSMAAAPLLQPLRLYSTCVCKKNPIHTVNKHEAESGMTNVLNISSVHGLKIDFQIRRGSSESVCNRTLTSSGQCRHLPSKTIHPLH